MQVGLIVHDLFLHNSNLTQFGTDDMQYFFGLMPFGTDDPWPTSVLLVTSRKTGHCTPSVMGSLHG
jgi:hypothetical protein